MPGVTVEQLKEFVRPHADDPRTPVLFAAWYNRDAEDHIYLLEVADGVANPGDASWAALRFFPPQEWGLAEGARLHLTFISPLEFFDAVRKPDSVGHARLEQLRFDSEVLYVAEAEERARRMREVVLSAQAA